jgi:hypothetical protein
MDQPVPERIRQDRMIGYVIAQQRRGRPLHEILAEPWLMRLCANAERALEHAGILVPRGRAASA